MAPDPGPVRAGEAMPLWECYWSAGGASGTVMIPAPDGPTAIATIEERPSCHGIPHDRPIVGHATRVTVREQGLEETEYVA